MSNRIKIHNTIKSIKGFLSGCLSDIFQSSFKGFFDVSLVVEIHLVNIQKDKQNFASKYLCRHAVEVVQ